MLYRALQSLHRRRLQFGWPVLLAVTVAGGKPMSAAADHWAPHLSPAEIQRLVTLDVLVEDQAGKPVPNAQMFAHCRPWDYTHRGTTDEAGRWRVRGPVGDWVLRAAGTGRQQGLMVRQTFERVEADREVTLQPTRTQKVHISRANGMPFGDRVNALVGPPQLSITPTDDTLPLDPAYVPVLEAGDSSWGLNESIKGWLGLLQGPTATTPGHVVFAPFDSGQTRGLVLNDAGLSTVRFELSDLPWREAGWYFCIEPLSFEAGMQAVSNSRIGSTGGRYDVVVVPGTYRVWLTFYPRSATGEVAFAGMYLARQVTVAAGETLTLGYGRGFAARVQRRAGSEFWVEVTDGCGNQLAGLTGTAQLQLTSGGEVVFDGPVTTYGGRLVNVPAAGPLLDQGHTLSYRYRRDWPGVGALDVSGEIPPGATMHDQAKIVAQTDRFTVSAWEPLPHPERLTAYLNDAWIWIKNYYGAEIKPRQGTRFDWRFTGQPGGSTVDGDSIETDFLTTSLCYPPDRWQGAPFFTYGLGSLYESHAPCQRPKWAQQNTSETFANLISGHLVTGLTGLRAEAANREFRSNQFFDWKLGLRPAPGEPAQLLYAMIFLELKDGQALTRDLFRALYLAQGNLGELIEQADFLGGELNRHATAVSFLADENVAWVYRWVGFDVTDDVVEKGLAYLKDKGATKPRPPF